MKISITVILLLITTLYFTSGCIEKEISVQETYIDTEYRTEYNLENKLVIEREVEPESGEESLEPVKSWNHATIFWEVVEQSPTTIYYQSIDNVWYYGFDIPEHKTSKIFIDIHTPENMDGPIVAALNFNNLAHIESCHAPIPEISALIGGTSSLDYNEEYNEWYETFTDVIDHARQINDISTDSGNSKVKNCYEYDVTGINRFVVLCVNAEYAWSPVMKTTLCWEDEKVTETEVMKEVEVPYQVPYEVEKQRTVTKVEKVPFWESWFNK